MDEEKEDYSKMSVSVKERLLQIQGHLFFYDSTGDKNILVKENVFLSIDKTDTYESIINVTDQKQQYSYTWARIVQNDF